MKINRKLPLYSLLLILILNQACSKNDLYNFVVGGQPTFVGSHPFLPGINVFGVIRTDSIGTNLMNSIHVEQVIPAVTSAIDSFTLIQYHVAIYQLKNQLIIDSVSFTCTEHDSVYNYKPASLNPLPGEKFQIICQSAGLPALTAETVMPNVPVILQDSVKYYNGNIQFYIANDTSAYLYDVYVYEGNNQYSSRILRDSSLNTFVTILAGQPQKGTIITVYAYDKNMTAYLTVPNLFIKPNTYRPPFSTVQNGYGCFGSMNLMNYTYP